MPRQTIYERDNWNEKLDLLEGWARDGLTDEQIATKMGIHVSTLYEYKKKYSELNETLKTNKEIADSKVEKALYNKALQGNNTAMIFWLKNRKPKKWRDDPKPKDESKIPLIGLNKQMKAARNKYEGDK